MLSDWVLAGQVPAHFYDVTLREFATICEAGFKRNAHQAWLAAAYARHAYHQPNKMPPDPLIPPKTRDQEVNAARAFFDGLVKGQQNGR